LRLVGNRRTRETTSSHQVNKKDSMQHQGKTPKELQEEYGYSYQDSMKNWRAWGSWFSWGSPVGLGLFFISIAATLWILSQAFGWK